MNQAIILRGNIEKVFYAGPKFSAGRLRGTDGKSHSFAGNLFATEGQHIALAGRWETHPDYGRQFKVDHVKIEMPSGAEGLAQFIANHPEVKGIGPTRAAKIVQAFGDDFERVLLEAPERIAQAARVPLPTIENLRNVWIASRKFNAAMTWLSAFGLTHHQVTTLIEKLGNNALAILRDDPYRLMREIKGLGFKKVDQIARKMGTAKEHQPRIRAGILHCIHEALGEGDCWVELEELVERANLLLIMDCLDSRERIEAELNGLIREKALRCVDMGGRVVAALPFIHEQESALATFFERGAEEVRRVETQELDEIIERACPTLNAKQEHAIRTALTQRISLISGGAGVGKSFCVSVIDSICDRLELQVALTAPTGKAAKRLEELSGREARTIHRLLGYDGSAFDKGPDDPIDADVLIVDEVSMVDVTLAWHLFQAVDLSRTSVVLVGDHNQLPPVGPGNILRDLIQTRAVPTTILDECVRQAGVLKENSTAILTGQINKTSDKHPDGRCDWYLVDQFTDPMGVSRCLREMFSNVLEEKLGFDLLRDVQVLTPTHKGPLGTQALNEELQRLVQRKRFGVEVPPRPANRRPPLLKGDKVIQTRNNYDLGVMNGSIGFVKDIYANGTLLIEFDDRTVEIEKGSENLRDIQLAYVLTFHKCVSGDTLIATANGLVPISMLAKDVEEGTTSPCLVPLSTHKGIGSAVSVTSEGEKDCIRLRTDRGFCLTASTDHKVFVATNEGFAWIPVSAISPGDTVVMRRGAMVEHSDLPAREVSHEGRTLLIDEEMGWVLGVLIGDGNQTDQKDYRVEVTKGAHDLLLRYVSAVQKRLGVRTTIRPVKENLRYSAYFHDKQARMLLQQAGLGFDKAAQKTTPWVVFESPVSVQRAYLRGLFDTDGGINAAGVHFTTASETLAAEVQQLLLTNGIVASNHQMRAPDPEKGWAGAWRVTISGSPEIRRFAEAVGFDGEMKDFALSVRCHLSGEDGFKGNKGFIPFGRQLILDFREELRARDGRNYQDATILGRLFSRIVAGKANLNHHHVEWLVRRVPHIETTGPAGAMLKEICDCQYVFERLAEKAHLRSTVYDFLVPGDHSYVGNGFVNHNCQGSEFPCAVVIVHKAHSFMHHRNLFYTGVTRARKTAIVLGDRWGVRNCAQKVQVDNRKTFLSQLLRTAPTSATCGDFAFAAEG